jgi:hypothetical protein
MNPGLEVTFADDRVGFPPDHLCRICGSIDVLDAAAILDADPAAAPPEIRALSGETLFISAEQRAELERFCQVNQIPIRTRPDMWGDLLEPFLDTEFTAEDDAATLGRLSRAGLTAAEVARIRAKVGPLMRAYNAVHWEWFHLGLADLLTAVLTTSLPEHERVELGEIASFYAWAMRIASNAGRGPVG